VLDLSVELAFFLIGALLFVGSGATQSYIVVYLQSLGYSALFGTIVLSIIYMVQIPTRFFIGYIEKWIGPRYSLIIGTAGYFLYALFFPLSSTWWHYILTMVMWGFTSALFWTGANVTMLNTSTKERYGRALGSLYAGSGIGPAVGVLIMSWLIANYHQNSIFFFSIIPAALATVIVATLDLEKEGSSKSVQVRTFRGFLKDPEILTVAFLLFVRSFSYGLVYGSFGSLIGSRMGREWIGPLTCSFYVLSGIFSRFGGTLSDKIGRRVSFVISFIIGGVGGSLLLFSDSKSAFILASAMLGYQASTTTVNASAWVGNVAEPEERSNLIAFTWGANAFGVMVSLILNGFFLGSAATSRWGFIIFAIANLAAGLLSYVMVKTEGVPDKSI
jgi:MFS family permease